MALWREHELFGGSTAVCGESFSFTGRTLTNSRQYNIEVFHYASHLFSPQDVCNGPGQECFAGAGRTVQQDALCT